MSDDQLASEPPKRPLVRAFFVNGLKWAVIAVATGALGGIGVNLAGDIGRHEPPQRQISCITVLDEVGGELEGCGADLAGTDLTGADLERTDLTVANLAGANLAGANLAGANLAGADLAGADLAGADLAGADLTGADLTGANLHSADLTGADLTRVRYDDQTRWPARFTPPSSP